MSTLRRELLPYTPPPLFGTQQSEELKPESCNILVIDDDPEALRMIRAVIERSGFRVDIAGDATEGIAIMARKFIDVVVCDIKMPGIDGISFVRRMKAVRTIPQGAKIPVILLTAGGTKLKEEAHAAGADTFCFKNQVHQKLVIQIQQIIRESSTSCVALDHDSRG